MKRLLLGLAVVAWVGAAKARDVTPGDAADMISDKRVQSAVHTALVCSIQRVADYINGGSKEPAQVLGTAAIGMCIEKWEIAAAIAAKVGPEYGITLDSLELLRIIRESYGPGVTSAAVEFRLPKKLR